MIPSKPYKIRPSFVKKSPFSNTESVKKSIQQYKKTGKLGFTQLSSLRSMGLVKRKNGIYKLGDKYK